MPLDEYQVNSDNIEDFANLTKTFNSHNIDLMFTISMLTTQFVDYELKMTPCKEIQNHSKFDSIDRFKSDRTNDKFIGSN